MQQGQLEVIRKREKKERGMRERNRDTEREEERGFETNSRLADSPIATRLFRGLMYDSKTCVSRSIRDRSGDNVPR